MHKKLFALLVLVLVVAGFGTAPSLSRNARATGGNPGEITGLAWSSNTGWISFNCSEEDTPCPHGNPFSSGGYAAKVDTTTGELSGWAWSLNLGWITFNKGTFGAALSTNNLSGCPSTPCEARLTVNPVSNRRQLTGWARVVSAPGGSGWDGFISLSPKTALGESGSMYNASASCVNAPETGVLGCYGPRMDISNNTFSGFAWGSDVVGWIDFGGTTGQRAVYLVPSGPTPGITITANPTDIENGQTTSLSWNVTNAASCTPTAGDSVWNANNFGNGTTGSPLTSSALTTTTTFTLSCTGSGGITSTGSATVTVAAVGTGSFNLTDTPASVAISFVSNKKETTTRTNVKVLPQAGFTKVVTVSLVNPTAPAEITGLRGVTPRARFRDRATGALTDTMGPADYATGRDLYIEFPCNGSSQCAVAAGTYHFMIQGTAAGSATKQIPLTVNVQSFIPAFQEQ